MSWFNNILNSFGRQPIRIEKNGSNVFYTMFSSHTAIGKVIPDSEKLKIVCENPALLKAISLDCDIFSLGKINKYDEGKFSEQDFLYSITKKPNLTQTWTQFLWDYKFWLNIYGSAYLYNPNNKKTISDSDSLIWLNPCNIEWNQSIINKLKSFFFSQSSYSDNLKATFTYRFQNGESKQISLKEITVFHDLTNAGSDNPMKGHSRVDALYKVIKNSELGLDAKAINLEFTQKFMVAGQADPDNVTQLPMSETEKISIEQSVRSDKNIHAVKSMIDIKRFVDDMAKLKLDEAFLADFFIFCSIYNIPKEISETSLRGSTFENQEKAMARFIEYCEAPKAQMLTDHLEMQFGLQDVRMSWSHLMFNQVFEKQRIENTGLKLDNIQKAKDLGAISENEAIELAKQLLL